MKFLIDGQLPEKLSPWLKSEFGYDVFHVKDLNLQFAEDKEVFEKAKELDATILTKDKDFLELQMRLGSPPKIIWVTSGNTSNKKLKQIFLQLFPKAIQLLKQKHNLVEISDII